MVHLSCWVDHKIPSIISDITSNLFTICGSACSFSLQTTLKEYFDVRSLQSTAQINKTHPHLLINKLDFHFKAYLWFKVVQCCPTWPHAHLYHLNKASFLSHLCRSPWQRDITEMILGRVRNECAITTDTHPRASVLYRSQLFNSWLMDLHLSPNALKKGLKAVWETLRLTAVHAVFWPMHYFMSVLAKRF